MTVIHKHKLRITKIRQTFNIPKSAIILDFQFQDEELCMWVLLDTEKQKDERTFRLIGTGEGFDYTRLHYYKTVQHTINVVGEGLMTLVWHIFEEDRNE